MNSQRLNRWGLVLVSLLFVAVLAGACKRSEPPAPAAPQATVLDRYTWNLTTLVEPYEKAGFTNAAWDQPARRALTEFARVRAGTFETNEPCEEIIATNCTLAIEAGCRDPMIRYLYVWVASPETNRMKVMEDFISAAKDLANSSYPGVRKFWAARRATHYISEFYNYSYSNTPPSIEAFLDNNATGMGLQAIIVDPTAPHEEIYQACHDLLEHIARSNYAAWYKPMSSMLSTYRPDSWATALIEGEAHVHMAWQARGDGYANTVTDEGWKKFYEHLAQSEEALSRAWELNPKEVNIPLAMLKVELGQGKGRDRLQLWFDRAVALDPGEYDAFTHKLFYLEPKWYGSEEDLLAFGWECVESKTAQGRTPLILLDAHIAIRQYREGLEKTNYWKEPDVWPDVKAAYDRFFELNPSATDWYHNYARSAYRCEAWDKLNELIPKLGPVNYEYFGGRAEFDKMVETARAHAGDAKVLPPPAVLDLKRLMLKVTAKQNGAKEKESDFAEELKQFDVLFDKYSKDKSDDTARILLAKAHVYMNALGNTSKAADLLNRVKLDFPETTSRRTAERMLAQIDRQEAQTKIEQSLAPGASFPAFDEKDLLGAPLSSDNCKGKVVLIDFWATWCGPCVAQLPDLLEIYSRHKDQGFEVIGVSLDEDRARLMNFIKQKDIKWPQFFDGEGWNNKLAVQYGIHQIPTTFLLDRKGRIIARDLHGETLEAAVTKALAEGQ